MSDKDDKDKKENSGKNKADKPDKSYYQVEDEAGESPDDMINSSLEEIAKDDKGEAESGRYTIPSDESPDEMIKESMQEISKENSGNGKKQASKVDKITEHKITVTNISEDELFFNPEELRRLESLAREKESQRQAYYDQMLRLKAEFENYKKRLARERTEYISMANREVLQGFLPVLDNIYRGIDSTLKSRDIDTVVEGMKLILGQFLKVLKDFGVEEFTDEGKEFDPNRHEVLMQVESTELDDNIIVEVFQKGYLLNGKLLRPALVSVSKRVKSDQKKEISKELSEVEENMTPSTVKDLSDIISRASKDTAGDDELFEEELEHKIENHNPKEAPNDENDNNSDHGGER